MFLKEAKLDFDYRWMIMLVPGLYALTQLILAMVFVNEADVFLAGLFFAGTILLMVSSCLYFLGIRAGAYIIVFIVFLLFLFLFYHYTGALFEFTGSDSAMYYRESQKRLGLSLNEALKSFVNNTKYGWDDSGMIIYSHVIFSCFDSVLFQRIINFFLLIIQATLLRAVLRRLLVSGDIINLTIGLYISNSAILYFVSSGLKETLFTTLIVCIWYLYFLNKKSIVWFFYLLVSTSSLYLFRIPEFLLTVVSLISKQSKKYVILLFLPLLCLLLFSVYKFHDVILWYMNRGEQDVAVARNMGFIYKLSVYSSGLFGPFATFISVEEQRDTLLYSMGLSTLMVIRLYALLSVKYLFKRSREIMPILVHIGLHILVLIIVDRTLKIRYWMPVIPAIFICFAYVLNLSERRGMVSLRMLSATFVTFVWLTFWNILRYNS